MDHQIILEFLQACVEAARLLGRDKALAQKWTMMLDRIPETKLGGDGRILEWIKEYKEAEPGHRHISRSEEHTSELQSLMRISYAVFCLKKKTTTQTKFKKNSIKYRISKCIIQSNPLDTKPKIDYQ